MKKNDDKEPDFEAEAAKLRLLREEDQRDIVAMYGRLGCNLKLTQADRDLARKRADALSHLLNLSPKRRS